MDAMQIFETLCTETSAEELSALREVVAQHVAALETEQRRSELIALDLANLIRERLERLIDEAPSLTPAERALVAGAARYFASRDDAVPDTRACTGLDDDVAVVNHVLRALGRDGWVIED